MQSQISWLCIYAPTSEYHHPKTFRALQDKMCNLNLYCHKYYLDTLMLIILIHIESVVKVHWLSLVGSWKQCLILYQSQDCCHCSGIQSNLTELKSSDSLCKMKRAWLDLGNQEVVWINASDSVVCSYHCVDPQHIFFLSHISFQQTENYFQTSWRQARTRIIELSSMSTSWLVTNFNVTTFSARNDPANKPRTLQWS